MRLTEQAREQLLGEARRAGFTLQQYMGTRCGLQIRRNTSLPGTDDREDEGDDACMRGDDQQQSGMFSYVFGRAGATGPPLALGPQDERTSRACTPGRVALLCHRSVCCGLDKAGGMLEAWRMIQTAKSMGMKTMLGCMISSSVTVTAAAHLSPLVDYADLDGNLLITNDPYKGMLVRNGRLVLPNRPGLGLVKA